MRQEVMADETNVAILIFEGVQIIDYTGPYEVFGQAGFEVFTVAQNPDPITTAMGMTVTPRYTFQNHPAADVLLIPGGNVGPHQNNPEVIRWIQENTKKAEVVLSVCNGAFFLAKAGLLDGLQATTFASLIPGLQQAAPGAKVVANQRFVDNGKIVTAAGLSSGIDGALHVVEKLLGRGWAQAVATGLEYNWDPESKYVRAALADRHIRLTPFLRSFERELVQFEGTENRWVIMWKVQTEPSSSFFDSINQYLASENNWNRQTLQDPGKSKWKFSDPEGRTWTGEVILEPLKENPGSSSLTVKVSRS
jgi:putative intracellular protease/amidase